MKKFARKNQLYVYIVFMLLMGALFTVSLFKYNLSRKGKNLDSLVPIKILEVSCHGTRNSKNYLVFKGKESNHIVTLRPSECELYKAGDTISVRFNKRHGIYYLTPSDDGDALVGMIVSVIFILITVIFIIYPRLFAHED